ncbi:uncharacterized protein LOC109139344 isoform X2 [Larimichthys crocea]|uniref:uncharacterized protein LOC109139344 isoform X2 n=1 Tax=Larimichthys crocea TaxID=215358 RepID=UPI000F5E3441|nr:uncharacterized protein LOC109139344 isoform X2 [Larimichthys crocea]
MDLTKTFLRTSIDQVLSDLPEMSKQMLEETLQSLGVETSEDFRFIKEEDLLSALRPIQAVAAWKLTFQISETSSSSVYASPQPSTSSASPMQSPNSSSSNSPSNDWLDKFVIPCEKFPEKLMQCLSRGTRPSPRLRREMVRILVRELNPEKTRIGKRHCVEVAKKMVAKYPQSLQDVIEGDIIGSGYHSLAKQLQNRIENVKRDMTPKIIKRRHLTADSDTDEIPPEKRAAVQDTYGCINWHVKFLPLEETPETQREKKEKLKVMSQQPDANPLEVKDLMKATYYTQRKQVNLGEHVKQLFNEWPFWFEELGMAVHFKQLTGVDLIDTFSRNVDLKGKRLLNYLNIVCPTKSKRFLQALTKLKMVRGEAIGCSEDLKEMILLLLSYFDDQETAMFCYVEETCLGQEVDVDQLQLTPTIVVCGRSCFSSKRYMLSVDKQIVNDNIPSFMTAVCLMFGSYYCFNIHYPAELASILEFLQRCFFSINPEKGTKVVKTSSRLPVNPRVLTLIQDLADHEWCNA